MFDRFPVRLLNRSIFVTDRFEDPRLAARMGWRAPVCAYVGLQPASPVSGPEFTYAASLMDVTGTIRARLQLAVSDEASRTMREQTPAAWARAEGHTSTKGVAWELALAGLHYLEPKDLEAVRWHLGQGASSQGGPAAFAALCSVMDRTGNDSWQKFLGALEQDRFTASAWFERDRSHLGLRDNVLDCDVVSLWDEAVHEELQSGYLTAPSRPRPSDADWQPHLVAFAQERGLITPLRGQQPQPSPERNRP
jgi:hypothetical protein